MLKGRGRDPRILTSPPPASAHLSMRPPAQAHAPVRPPAHTPQRVTLARPEPDYEVVEFPGEQYVNAKLQPPPPPPPRPPTGHPPDAGASCGLCGGGGARVRCAECGRRALCASCDDMYHRHPKRRNHQRQALSQSQLRDDRPPLPPKVAPPVPPPRRHKIGGDRMSASPKPPMMDQRRATLGHMGVMMGPHNPPASPTNHMPPQHAHQQIPLHLQAKMNATPAPNQMGSIPFLPTNVHHPITPVVQSQMQSNTLGHMSAPWNRPRGSLQGFNMHPNMAVPTESWENPENMSHSVQNWGRPLRRGASVLELGGGAAGAGCAGCAHCAAGAWRYGSCASLDHAWPGAWPPAPPPACCATPHPPHHAHMHPHSHPPQTPQPYRRAESRPVSRAASRAGSRATSPAMSVRSRTSRRTKHRTPSPPPLPSSDADTESESDSDRGPAVIPQEERKEATDSLASVPPPPTSKWQCEHCTFVNEPGVRVCVICCRTPTTAAQTITTHEINEKVERLKITQKESPPPVHVLEEPRAERSVERVGTRQKKERASTGCGPSPPRDGNKSKKQSNRRVTPTREQITDPNEKSRERHDMAVGPSPPREAQNGRHAEGDLSISPPRDLSRTVRVTPHRDIRESPKPEPPKRHNISVGPSPPRDNAHAAADASTKNPTRNVNVNVQKKSTGTSPPRETIFESRTSIVSSKTNLSNTGTSPPPQSISTQTYEVPSTWERAPSATRARPRRRFRDDSRRERSHSRHSLSSDTRESERSVRTAAPDGRWEWRERDSSPDNYSRLSRRASHLDLRRTRPNRRSSYYGSEAASPERQCTTRAISLEALAGAGARREAERGIELAQLMSEAERLGFSAAEVQAALTQSPAAPLAWLRERWPSLCAGVRAAAARLAPAAAAASELDARAALARHRGAMWPAVTECVERYRRQAEARGVGPERRLRGRVWGAPAGADDDAAPTRQSHRTREDSSDEFEVPTPSQYRDDDWMYLPLDASIDDAHRTEMIDPWNDNSSVVGANDSAEDLAKKLKILLTQVGAPSIDENLLLKGLMAGNMIVEPTKNSHTSNKSELIDLIPSENDFIDAYNALTRASPLPNINDSVINIVKTKNKNQPTENNSELALPPPKNEQPATKSDELIKVIALNEEKPQFRAQSHQQNIADHKSSPSDAKNYMHINGEKREQPTLNADNIHPIEAEPKSSNISRSEENTQEHKSDQQSEEKSNNLNDIVDNTQRLIQQMKEEINSDINSIDGRTMSHSEPESSSNEEQESSYSDTDDRSSDATMSDEKEVTTSDDEDLPYSESEKRATSIQHRTSSEDNDNFEEALEHVENQLEDFKHANIEMLDSIARSLQEEHSDTVEIYHPKVQSVAKQDLNNNLFTAVNSFDEIYEQLNNKNTDNDNIGKIQQDLLNVSVENDIHYENIDLLAKQTINMSVFKTVAPNKLLIFENAQPVFNATIEHFEEKNSNDIVEPHNDIAEVQDAPNSQHILPTIESFESELVSDRNHRSKSSSPQSIPEESIRDSDHYANNGINSSNSSSPSTNSQNKPEDDNTEQNDTRDHSDKNIPMESTILTFIDDVDTFIENVDNEQPTINNNDTIQDVDQNQSSRSKNVSPDKSIVNPTSGSASINNKVSSNNKSNIPKPVKTTNNKTRNDKNSPKVIVSKVPVRRASLKQYPAPAPPKSHFGNIQSGHVKQLQTRLFNSKITPTKVISNSSETVAVTPSTSTLNKKKQAPAPPPPTTQQTEKPHSPPEIPTPAKTKKQYFRETCRTEDEWTDSDSEDSQIQVVKPSEEPSYRPPSPPPPITLRRVSGQLIDLARVQLPEGSPERQARMLLAEGASETWEQAQIAVELISRGADPAAALLAALECADLPSALAYLYQDCELCASRLPEHEMVSMLRCTHRCCRECAHHYFTVQISERSIADCVCPYCKLPELESLPEDAWLEYFAHLDILLKTLLETDVHELFQRKLRDRTLARDPNFRWCMECSSGFFVHPKQKKIRCPECRSVSCASCRKTWSANHEGLTCEQYTAWLEDNDPERSVTAIQQHLRDNGLECPRCHFKYSLSRGGCMHFTCTQCKYEFCYGCGKPFTMGARCGLSDYCAKLGLHAHHPRNCLFYLRDKEPRDLQTLLQMNNVTYETEPAEGSTGRCPIQLQRETPTGLIDGTCGSEAPANYAGLCKNHYLEYLSRTVRGLGVDPLPILGIDDLETLVRRAALRLPPRPYGSLDGLYKRSLVEIVKEKIPLD